MEASARVHIGEALRVGWRLTWKHFVLWIGVYVTVFVATAVLPAMAAAVIDDESVARGLLMLVLQVATWVLQVLFTLGMMRIVLTLVDGGTPTFRQLGGEYQLILPYLGGSLIFGIIVAAGLLLLVVPGIIWALMFQFFGYLMLDQHKGPLDALNESRRLTRGVKWELLALSLLLIVINVVGMLALGIGLLVTAPLTMVTIAVVYRQLTRASVTVPVVAMSAAPLLSDGLQSSTSAR